MRLLDKNGITLDSRNRLELRTFEEGSETGFRFRPFVQLKVPISEHNKIVAYSEPFFAINETPFQDEAKGLWRHFLGVSIPITDGVEMVPGYLNQTVFRTGENRMDHTANVNLFMKF